MFAVHLTPAMTLPLSPPEVPSTPPVVLVLPFVSRSGDEGAYLTEGVSDELILALSQLDALEVIGRGTTATFRGATDSPDACAALAGANVIVTGTVEAVDTRIGVSMRVARVGNRASEKESNEWFESLRLGSGVAHLAERVSFFCRTPVTEEWRNRVSRPISGNAEAVDLVLRGRYHLEQRPIGVKLAMQCFDRAIGIDGDVSGAHGALGALWANFGIFLALPPNQASDRSRTQAQRALAIDSRDPNALAALLTVAAFYDWDLPLADALGAQLLAWYPSWVIPRQVLLYAHAARGDAVKVRQLGREVQRLDPRSVDPVNDYAFALILTGGAQEATVLLAAHLELHPEASEVERRLGLAWLEAGDAEQAVKHLERSVKLSRRHAWGVANLACARARGGDDAGARELLAELVERADGELVPAVALAEVHASLGESDAAFDALERGVAARDYWLLMIDADPLLNPLRSDSRFAPLRSRCIPLAHA